MIALLALSLTLAQPGRTAFAPEQVLAAAFASDAEATNFSERVSWSAGIPLGCGYALGRKALWACGAGWLAYSVVNEFALHGPESARERNLNLVSRLVPCALVLVLDLWGHR